MAEDDLSANLQVLELLRKLEEKLDRVESDLQHVKDKCESQTCKLQPSFVNILAKMYDKMCTLEKQSESREGRLMNLFELADIKSQDEEGSEEAGGRLLKFARSVDLTTKNHQESGMKLDRVLEALERIESREDGKVDSGREKVDSDLEKVSSQLDEVLEKLAAVPHFDSKIIEKLETVEVREMEVLEKLESQGTTYLDKMSETQKAAMEALADVQRIQLEENKLATNLEIRENTVGAMMKTMSALNDEMSTMSKSFDSQLKRLTDLSQSELELSRSMTKDLASAAKNIDSSSKTHFHTLHDKVSQTLKTLQDVESRSSVHQQEGRKLVSYMNVCYSELKKIQTDMGAVNTDHKSSCEDILQTLREIRETEKEVTEDLKFLQGQHLIVLEEVCRKVMHKDDICKAMREETTKGLNYVVQDIADLTSKVDQHAVDLEKSLDAQDRALLSTRSDLKDLHEFVGKSEEDTKRFVKESLSWVVKPLRSMSAKQEKQGEDVKTMEQLLRELKDLLGAGPPVSE